MFFSFHPISLFKRDSKIVLSRHTGVISEEIGFEQDGDNYYLTDSDFKYEVYMFDRPHIWKLNQKMSEREKFIVATLIEKDNNLKDNLEVTIRKTKDFITLSL